jgi:predicted GIY-YIG superfamily endonuclease
MAPTYIYIVEIEENATGARTYVGITNDLHRRFAEEGKRGWLSRQVRIRMIYCDSTLYRGTPRETEKWIKGWSQMHKLECIDETFADPTGELSSIKWRPFWHRCSHPNAYQVGLPTSIETCPDCHGSGGVFD